MILQRSVRLSCLDIEETVQHRQRRHRYVFFLPHCMPRDVDACDSSLYQKRSAHSLYTPSRCTNAKHFEVRESAYVTMFPRSHIRTLTGAGGRVAADVRNYWIHKLMFMSARTIMQNLYPPLLALHDLHETIAVPNPNTGEIDFPALMRNSYLFMAGHGVYLIGELHFDVL